MWQKRLQLSVPESSWQQEGTAAAEVELTGCSLRGIGQVDAKLVTQW